MGLYYYRCNECGKSFGRLMTPVEVTPTHKCVWCFGTAVRAPKAPTTQVLEKIDNGLMSRAIERPADATRMFKERSEIDYVEKDSVANDFKDVDK